MPSVDTSIETTVHHLESVTAEIKKLRDAVAVHRDAALGLETLTTKLTDLSQQLQRLPAEVKSQFSGVAQLVTQVGDALRPAGTVESAVRELVLGNEKLLAQLQRERELSSGEMRGLREELSSLRVLVSKQNQQTHDSLQQIATQTSASDTHLTQLAQRFDKSSSSQARDTEAIKTRLAKLTGLARRGFFALLRGKDAVAEPL